MKAFRHLHAQSPLLNRAVVPALFTIMLAAATATAQFQAVVPNNFKDVEGNSSSSSLFQAGPASLQVYYSEAFLGASGITPGTVINGVAYRRNGGGANGPAGDTTFTSYHIFMSESFATPASMTTTFANNVVGPQTQVYSASLTFPAGSVPGGITPNAFGPTIDFTTPYIYDGGALLIEIRRSARSGDTTSFNTDVDNTAATQVGARWLFNTSSDAAVTGTLSSSGQIFQLQYIPEPSTAAIAGLAALALAGRRRRQHKG
jgi:MYXO-CTERM domain-containing protein